MKKISTQISINAPAASVWTVLTDAKNLPEWSSGIIKTEGNIARAGKFKLWSEVVPERAFALNITQFQPNSLMVWASGMPLGLFRGERQFHLTETNGTTHFTMEETFTGPLLSLIWKSMPDLQPSFDKFAKGLKQHVEQMETKK